ncbi:LOW QUALITY PROTEIN: hypothetical protein Cgig2_011067 [Carnegiea gigantea]|uniref:Uncharacterized protein n=1 Tax=Carnegiea gigantea TaxID=171969 RepID=A0A9Q1GIR8_9CARY|nr:LOW QUALITY PROTEIN: hypothetical protein Cgig2_011067 [Carnegiea gigantea]
MAFPHFLRTSEMTLYVLENFKWDWREATFPPLPLIDNCQDLSPDFDLTEAKEAVQDFLLPKISQVVFYVMLLNDPVRQGVLSRGMIEILESALWSAFEEWVWRNRGNILWAQREYSMGRLSELDSSREESSESEDALPLPLLLEMSRYGRSYQGNFQLALKEGRTPPQPLPENYHNLCPDFILFDVEEAARDFHILKMAVIYAMVVNEALEVEVLSRDLVERLNSALEGLRWLQLNKHALLWHIAMDRSTKERGLGLRVFKRKARGREMLRLPLTLDLLMAEGYSEGNSRSTSSSHRMNVELATSSPSTSVRDEDSGSSSYYQSTFTSKRSHALYEVVTEGTVFPRAPNRWYPQNGPSTYFPDLRGLCNLKTLALEEKYFLPIGYRFITPDTDATSKLERYFFPLRTGAKVGTARSKAPYGVLEYPPREPQSTLVESLTKSWVVAPSSLVEPPKVIEEQVAIVEAFARALKGLRLIPSVSAPEKQIHNLESSNALLQGQIGDFQTERKK